MLTRPEKEISVLAIDDHALYLNGLTDALRRFPYIKSVHRSLTGVGAIECLQEQKIDVVFLDYQLKEMNGLQVLNMMRSRQPNLPVIALSTYNTFELVKAMIDGGAMGYITKDDVSGKELNASICAVLSGHLYFSQAVSETLANDNLIRSFTVADNQPSPVEGLTERQIQVIRYFTMGNTTKQMADKMYLSTGTVETYRKQVLHKTKSKNILDVARFALKHGIVSFSEFLNGKIKEDKNKKK